MVRHREWAAASLIVVLTTACHTPSHHASATWSRVPPAGPEDVYPRLHSPARAHALADATVTGLAMPPGTLVQSTPRMTLAQLGGPMILTRADGLRTWRLPVGSNAAVAWLTTHPPEGQTLLMTNQSPAWPAELTAQTAGSHQPPIVQLSLRVTPERGGSEVFADATVLWSPARSAAETVPVATSAATLDYVRPRLVTHWVVPGRKPSHVDVVRPPLHVRRTLTPGDTVAIVAVLNASLVQSPSPPDTPPSCTPDDERATLTLRYADHTATFVASFEGCHDIDVTVDGTSQPTLDGGSDLGAVIRPMVGLPAEPTRA